MGVHSTFYGTFFYLFDREIENIHPVSFKKININNKMVVQLHIVVREEREQMKVKKGEADSKGGPGRSRQRSVK